MAQLKSTNIFGTLEVQALTQSISTSTGALIVAGGVGIKKDIYIGGNANVARNETVAGTLAVTGAVTGLKFNNLTITSPANGSVLTIADGKTLTVSTNKTLAGAGTTLTLGGNLTTSGAHTTTFKTTANTNVTLPTTGTLAVIDGKLSQFDATTSSELAGVISDETGTGALVFGTSPTLTTSLKTGSTSFDLLNTVATTLNIGGASTTINMGAATGTTTVNNDLVVSGNLTISGKTNTLDTEILTVEDKNIELGKVTTPTNATANLGGITLLGGNDGNKTIIWNGGNWTSSEHWNIATDKTYKINNTEVLSATTLGSNIKKSSLTKVGTIIEGTWQGGAIADDYINSASTWSAKQDALTFGIENTNAVKINSDSVVSDSYAKFTTSGLEGKTIKEVKTDLNLSDVENTRLSDWAGTSNITTVGAVSGTSFNNLKIISPENSATLEILDSKTLTINNTITLSATNDSKTLNIGNGGTLESGAFTDAYSLTAATSDALGGVKIGDGISINGGKISVATNYSSDFHIHGNIENDGKIGTSAGVVMTGLDGSVNVISLGEDGEFLAHDGSWATPPNDNTNYYPDAFSWTGGTTAGPTGSLSGTGMTTVGFGAIPSASATASGIVTTGAQTFAGNKTISGDLSATRVYNAVWNDIADFLEVDEDIDIEYGKAYFRDNNGKVRKTNKRNSYSIGIASDTFGFGVGRKDENIKQIPIAIGGWVLACVDNIYKAGTPLIATKDGNLTKASLLTKSFYPERIIAAFDREEKEEFWNKIKVAGRCWVKVK